MCKKKKIVKNLKRDTEKIVYYYYVILYIIISYDCHIILLLLYYVIFEQSIASENTHISSKLYVLRLTYHVYARTKLFSVRMFCLLVLTWRDEKNFFLKVLIFSFFFFFFPFPSFKDFKIVDFFFFLFFTFYPL